MDRQKLLFKGVILKSSLENVPDGAQLIMMGSTNTSTPVDTTISVIRESEARMKSADQSLVSSESTKSVGDFSCLF